MGDKASFQLDISGAEGVKLLERFAHAAEEAAKAGKHVEDSAKGAGHGMSSMLGAGLAGGIAGAGANLLADMGRAALQGAEEVAKSSVILATSRQSMEASLGAILKSSEKAQQAMGLIKKVSAMPGLTDDATQQGFLMLVGAGIRNVKVAADDMVLFGNASALGTKGIEGLNNALTQWTQALRRGKFEEEEVKTLLETFPTIGDAMEKRFGGTTAAAINKTVKSVADLHDKMMQVFADQARAPDLMANAWQNMQNDIKNVKAEFGSGFVDKEAQDAVNELGKRIRGLGPIARETGNVLSNALTWALKQATQAWDSWATGRPALMLQYSTPGMSGLPGAMPAITAPPPATGMGALRAAENRQGLYGPAWSPEGGGSGLSNKPPPNPEDEKRKAKEREDAITKQMNDELAWLKAMEHLWDRQHPSTTGFDPFGGTFSLKNPYTARREAKDAALAKRQGPAAVAQLQSRRADDASDAEKKRLDELVTMLEVARAEYEMNVPAAADRLGGINEVERKLSAARRDRAKLDGPAAEAKAELEALKDSREEQHKFAQERIRNAEQVADWQRVQLELLEQQGASYAEVAKAIDLVRSAELAVVELKLREKQIDGEGVGLATARIEAETRRLSIDRDAKERRYQAGQKALTDQADIAGMQADLALTPAEEAIWLDRQIEALRQKAAALSGVAGAERDRLQVMLEIRRLEDDRKGRLTRGQEVLQASLGGRGGLDAWLKRQGGGDVSVYDGGAGAIDFNDFRGLRKRGQTVGDAPEGGLLGALQGGIAAGIGDATPAVLDAVRAATAEGMGTMAGRIAMG